LHPHLEAIPSVFFLPLTLDRSMHILQPSGHSLSLERQEGSKILVDDITEK
jgi:hypothetical protein